MVYLYVYLIIYGVYIGVRSGYVLNQYQHSVRVHAPISSVTKHGVYVKTEITTYLKILHVDQVKLNGNGLVR